MIVSVKDTFGKTVRGTDGDIGVVTDVFFDDDRWTIRYLVIETGEWLNRREVLVSPASKLQGIGEGGVIGAQLSRDQVRNGPDIDMHKPISRQLEIEFNRYYRLPFYWGGDAIFG
ncbi:MAG: PRC-barrel domain-containing protein, partial [Rudaea sp.]